MAQSGFLSRIRGLFSGSTAGMRQSSAGSRDRGDRSSPSESYLGLSAANGGTISFIPFRTPAIKALVDGPAAVSLARAVGGLERPKAVSFANAYLQSRRIAPSDEAKRFRNSLVTRLMAVKAVPIAGSGLVSVVGGVSEEVVAIDPTHVSNVIAPMAGEPYIFGAKGNGVFSQVLDECVKGALRDAPVQQLKGEDALMGEADFVRFNGLMMRSIQDDAEFMGMSNPAIMRQDVDDEVARLIAIHKIAGSTAEIKSMLKIREASPTEFDVITRHVILAKMSKSTAQAFGQAIIAGYSKIGPAVLERAFDAVAILSDARHFAATGQPCPIYDDQTRLNASRFLIPGARTVSDPAAIAGLYIAATRHDTDAQFSEALGSVLPGKFDAEWISNINEVMGSSNLPITKFREILARDEAVTGLRNIKLAGASIARNWDNESAALKDLITAGSRVAPSTVKLIRQSTESLVSGVPESVWGRSLHKLIHMAAEATAMNGVRPTNVALEYFKNSKVSANQVFSQLGIVAGCVADAVTTSVLDGRYETKETAELAYRRYFAAGDVSITALRLVTNRGFHHLERGHEIKAAARQGGWTFEAFLADNMSAVIGTDDPVTLACELLRSEKKAIRFVRQLDGLGGAPNAQDIQRAFEAISESREPAREKAEVKDPFADREGPVGEGDPRKAESYQWG